MSCRDLHEVLREWLIQFHLLRTKASLHLIGGQD